jgi:acetylornithine deacetylase
MTNIHTLIESKTNELKDEIISFVQRLVQTPSLANEEGSVQKLIFDKLQSLNLQSETIPVKFKDIKDHPAFNDDGFSPDSRINVIGQWNSNKKGKSLILNGHVDVVPTGPEKLWTESPWSGVIKNDRIYGRGSCDMKAGLASGIFAVQVLKSIGFEPSGNIMIQSVIGEESGGCGTLTNIVKGYTADAAVILEPTSLKLCPIQSGALTFRLIIPGKATHAAMRWDGVSAIEKFNLVSQSIIEFEKKRHSSFSVEYYESPERVAPINIGTIKGGEWHSTVPESVIAEGRLGVFPGESVSDARMAFSKHLKKVSDSDLWLKENPPILEWFEGQFESGKTDVEHSIINNLKMAYKEVNNSSAKIEGVTYGSDLRLFTNHADIPAVLFGPGDVRLAHSANENVKIEEVLTCIKIISNLIINWCEE